MHSWLKLWLSEGSVICKEHGMRSQKTKVLTPDLSPTMKTEKRQTVLKNVPSSQSGMFKELQEGHVTRACWHQMGRTG